MENDKNKFQYLDSLSNPQEIEIGKDDFKFVQNNKKIHDVKLKGKPVTFFKDAMKRFVTNKSSVTGGVILGFIILCAIFLPICIPDVGCYDVSTTHLLNPDGIKSEKALPPKLFSNANGFWDGTIKKEGITYDMEAQTPVEYEMRTVSNLTVEEYYSDIAANYGLGGYINLTKKDIATSSLVDYYSYTYNYDFSYSYDITYRFVKNYNEGYKEAKYRISLITMSGGVKTYYPLTGLNEVTSSFDEGSDLNKGFVSSLFDKDEEGTLKLNVSSIMKDSYGVTSLSSARINIDMLDESDDTNKSSILIESLDINSEDDPNTDYVSSRSIIDANNNLIQEQKISKEGSIDKINNPAYWTGKTSNRSALNVKFARCNFLYDMYEDVYGDKVITLNSYKVNQFITLGYFNYDPSEGATDDPEVLASRYESLNSKSNPIVKIVSQTGTATYSKTDKNYTGFYLTCVVSQYKYLGYSSKPIYLFGTDNYGRDYLKTLATSLRLSLLIAFGCALINIVIGIIWGSISGYFGGWTDITMERICDIVSGLPSIAIITLCILHLHNDMLAFIISMFMTGWMGVAGRTRTQFYRYKGREYVLASRTLGARSPRLIFKHILPNSMGTIITSSILMIPSVIYSEASISYLKLGLSNQLLFGVILSENSNIFEGYTMYLLIIPTVIMAFLLVSFNLFGNGLRDAFNPSLKGGE